MTIIFNPFSVTPRARQLGRTESLDVDPSKAIEIHPIKVNARQDARLKPVAIEREAEAVPAETDPKAASSNAQESVMTSSDESSESGITETSNPPSPLHPSTLQLALETGVSVEKESNTSRNLMTLGG